MLGNEILIFFSFSHFSERVLTAPLAGGRLTRSKFKGKESQQGKKPQVKKTKKGKKSKKS